MHCTRWRCTVCTWPAWPSMPKWVTPSSAAPTWLCWTQSLTSVETGRPLWLCGWWIHWPLRSVRGPSGRAAALQTRQGCALRRAVLVWQHWTATTWSRWCVLSSVWRGGCGWGRKWGGCRNRAPLHGGAELISDDTVSAVPQSLYFSCSSAYCAPTMTEWRTHGHSSLIHLVLSLWSFSSCYVQKTLTLTLSHLCHLKVHKSYERHHCLSGAINPSHCYLCYLYLCPENSQQLVRLVNFCRNFFSLFVLKPYSAA